MKDDSDLHTLHYITGSPTTVHVGGDVDHANIGDVEAVIRHGIELRAGDVHVDLSGLGFAEVSLVNALVRLQQDADKGRGRLVLCNPPPSFVRLLARTGTRELFDLG
jgi:anti-anti-sigma factor